MKLHLFDSELRLMELVWEKEPVYAKALSLEAAQRLGWNKNTTYTVLKKLVEKGYVLREEPNFLCSALVQKKQVAKEETDSLIRKLYGGSKKAFFAAFLDEEQLSDRELQELRALIDSYEK